jgi:hypothetical protein
VTGQLTMQNTNVQFRGDLVGFQFYDNTGTTLRGRINSMADRVVWNSQQPLLFEVGVAERMRIATDGLVTIQNRTSMLGALGVMVPADYWSPVSTSIFFGNIGYVGSNGSNRVGLYSNTYRNASGSTNGGGFAGSAAIEVDPAGMVYFRAEAGIPAGTGPANIGRWGPNTLESYTPVYVDGQFRAFQDGLTGLIAGSNGTSYLGFYTNATNYSTLGTRSGYVGFSSANNLLLNNEMANGNIYLDAGSGGFHIYRFAGGEQFRMIPQALLIGKTAYNTYTTTSGIELWTADGQLMITQTTNTFNSITHVSAADVASMSYLRFYRTGTTLLGQIRQVSTTGVEYLTTSDKRQKTFVRNVDDFDALDAIRAMAPVHFTWNDNPDTGEHLGFFAQDLYEIAPEAVGVGVGEPGDEDFEPWGVDYGRLTPRIIAALQALDHRITDLEH